MTPIDPKQIRTELAKSDAFAGGEIINAIANLAETNERSVEDVIAAIIAGTFILAKDPKNYEKFCGFVSNIDASALEQHRAAIRAAVQGDD